MHLHVLKSAFESKAEFYKISFSNFQKYTTGVDAINVLWVILYECTLRIYECSQNPMLWTFFVSPDSSLINFNTIKILCECRLIFHENIFMNQLSLTNSCCVFMSDYIIKLLSQIVNRFFNELIDWFRLTQIQLLLIFNKLEIRWMFPNL